MLQSLDHKPQQRPRLMSTHAAKQNAEGCSPQHSEQSFSFGEILGTCLSPFGPKVSSPWEQNAVSTNYV